MPVFFESAPTSAGMNPSSVACRKSKTVSTILQKTPNRNIITPPLAYANCGVIILKKINWKQLLICILIPLAVGGLAALLTRNSMETFGMLNQPPLSPPAWLFPVVWGVLYTLMGIASYLVLNSGKSPIAIRTALRVYGLQLAFNFFWTLIFFNLNAYFFAFFWLIVLWLLIFLTGFLFYQIRKSAGWLILPYFLWVTFAAYLNLAIAILN